MVNNKVKNTIVLRGMASNVVDEAIVILKPHIKIKKTSKTKNVREKSFTKDLILKEAENIVTEYVDQISKENLKYENLKLEGKLKKQRIILAFMFGLLILSLILK